MTFGEFARFKRIEQELTLDEVAKALGYADRVSIHALETGRIRWKLVHIQALADLFGLTLGQLMNEYESLKGV
jgi:transcriptional regulator with XRE-family HTH domain